MKKALFSDKAPVPIAPYSQAIEVNGTVYISGQLPVIALKNELITDDIERAVRQIFKNIS
jgi:2-iminobutanoate/2-iminopropanoate deaminase